MLLPRDRSIVMLVGGPLPARLVAVTTIQYSPLWLVNTFGSIVVVVELVGNDEYIIGWLA